MLAPPATELQLEGRVMVTMDEDAAIKQLFSRYSGNGSTADAIHDAVAEGILSRTLPPGWRLGEERLATLFSVSRTPVREALMRLESESLAARNRRSGLVVANVTAEQILEIYVIREALDGVAARQAAHFHSPVDVAALKRLNEALGEASAAGAWDQMAQLNVEFHTALARASRNEMLQRFVDQVHQAVRRFQRTTFSAPGRADEAVREHVAIIDAVERQDEAGAETAAREHMQHALAARMAMELERD
jgi:DNA-binding GntR family transcriptional regulator